MGCCKDSIHSIIVDKNDVEKVVDFLIENDFMTKYQSKQINKDTDFVTVMNIEATELNSIMGNLLKVSPNIKFKKQLIK